MSVSYPVYPGIATIRGITWKITRTPSWETQVSRMSSGKEFRLSYYTNPLWKWELEYNYLKDSPSDLVPGNTETDFAILQGFFNQQGGQFGFFLFDDCNAGDQPGSGPWDSVQGQAIATGDGVTTTFNLIRTSGGFSETIQTPFMLDGSSPTPNIYLNGVLKSYGTDYSIGATGILTFTVAPGNGVAITADFSYYWPVRFGSDELDFDAALYQLWALKKVTLQQVRL